MAKGEEYVPTRRILILDPRPVFADILREGIEQAGQYVVSVAATGEMALRVLQRDSYHLAIIDVAVRDVAPADLLVELRKIDPYLHVVFIPSFGQELADPLAALDIQGVLHKPFFTNQLDRQIRGFLQKKVITAPPTRTERLREQLDWIEPMLVTFFQELSAELVALVCQEEWIVCLGNVPHMCDDTLLELLEENLQVSGRLAALLGETGQRFELLSFVGRTASFYVLPFDQEVALVAVPGNGVPQGVVHLHIKRVVESLSSLLENER